MSKTLLVITGPQGSGNHLFSKIFAANANVFGWDYLTNNYWAPHDQEPFAEAWRRPLSLKDIQFDKFAFTSISCPYMYKGSVSIPDYKGFVNAAKDIGYNLKFAIIGRDKNILEHQQTRLRGQITLPHFEKAIPYLMGHNPVYLSTELLYLYKANYIKSIAKQLEFPVHVDPVKLDEILSQDPNAKYFSAVGDQPLDLVVRTASGLNNTKAE
jgi:hypothetical protein